MSKKRLKFNEIDPKNYPSLNLYYLKDTPPVPDEEVLSGFKTLDGFAGDIREALERIPIGYRQAACAVVHQYTTRQVIRPGSLEARTEQIGDQGIAWKAVLEQNDW